MRFFEQRFISRAEHQQIVDYYRRLVWNLQDQLDDLQSKVDGQDSAIGPIMEPRSQFDRVSASSRRNNVIMVDFANRMESSKSLR